MQCEHVQYYIKVHTGAVVLTMVVVQMSKKLIEIILVSDPVVL